MASNLDVVFLSDLHLGAAATPATAPYVVGFARFLDHLRARASAERRPCRLVLLGDSLDFMRIRLSQVERPHPVDTSAESAISKLEELARREPLFFAALGRFAGEGLPIDIVAGNHDIDLVRSSAQQRLRQLVEQASRCSGAGERIRFHPWIYHIPGIVYAEHGQQHHDINSFATVVRPYGLGNDHRLDLPLAAHLPASGRPWPLGWVPGFMRAGMSVASQSVQSRIPGRPAGRMRYREDVLRPYAADVGLDHSAVVAIDELAEVSAMSVATRLLRKGITSRGRTARPTQQGGYLHGAALAIDRILTSSGGSVPNFVFGHTHIAEQFPLVPTGSSPMYLNTGTWSPDRRDGVNRNEGSPLLTLVQVRVGSGTRPFGEVLVWDDKADRLRLLPDRSG